MLPIILIMLFVAKEFCVESHVAFSCQAPMVSDHFGLSLLVLNDLDSSWTAQAEHPTQFLPVRVCLVFS